MKVTKRMKGIGNQIVLYDEKTKQYFLVSSVKREGWADETLIFKCDSEGKVELWTEVWACYPSNHWPVIKMLIDGKLTSADFEEIE